jgi:nucleotide-binding universal stress UspA family protein
VLLEESQRSDLLLIGCNKVTKAGKHTLGVEALLRNANRPIVLAPHGGIASVDTVLVAYDGSPEAAKTLEVFQLLGLASGRSVHLLCVSSDEAVNASVESAADYLRLHRHNVSILKQTSRTAPGQVIISEAQRVGAGVIVMGAYGRGRVLERLLGSVTREVINHTRIPLFLYH